MKVGCTAVEWENHIYARSLRLGKQILDQRRHVLRLLGTLLLGAA